MSHAVDHRERTRIPEQRIADNTQPTGLDSESGAAADTDNTDWRDRSLCAQTDPEAFFPEKGGSTREAKRICTGCEVRAECLEYALGRDERFGIWGGLSERERRRLRKNRGEQW